MMTAAVPLLLEAALRALLAAIVLWAGLRALRVENVMAQKAAWGLMLAAALAMPLAMRWQWLPDWAAVKLPMPAWSALHGAVRTAAPATVAAISSPSLREFSTSNETSRDRTYRFGVPEISNSQFEAEPNGAAEIPPVSSSASAAPAMTPLKREPVFSRLLSYAGLLYLCVGAALVLRLLLGLGASIRLWMQAAPLGAVSEFDLIEKIPVRSSRSVASPVNIGSGIVLPEDFVDWNAEKLRVVLAHERSHVRQRDFYLQLLAGLYAALTWFSPLGWWLKRKLSELGEAISDRAGLEAAASRSSYAQVLLEFAALPRPTVAGVAMAHSSNLSGRIERLLNDASFRKAFAGSRRAVLAVSLFPAALFAFTALVHVQAAQLPQEAAETQVAAQVPEQSAMQSSTPPAVSGQSHPEQAPVTDETQDQVPPPAAIPQPTPAPSPAPAPDIVPVPPLPAAPGPDGVPTALPVPPVGPGDLVVRVPPVPPMPDVYHDAFLYADGEPYAVVGDPGTHPLYYGYWDGQHKDEIERARSLAHGHFLWFRHDGKSYIVDDPTIVTQIEAMQKPMDDLGAQMKALGKQMRDVGQQDRELGRKAREASENIPAPDLSKEMADLNAAVASLKDKEGGTVTREQLAEVQRKLAEVQRRLMSAQIKVDVHLDFDQMGKLGAEQGKFGAQMGKLGAEMGRVARENDQKIRSIIDESLKDGKARPVE